MQRSLRHELRAGALRLMRALLRIPLSWKILVANAAVVTAAAGGAVYLLQAFPRLGALPPAVLMGASATAALLVGTVVNTVLVRVALRPVHELERAAERVAEGDLEARAAVPAVADRRLRKLAEVLNGMVDRLAGRSERRRRLAISALEEEDRARRRLAATLQEDTAQRLASHLLGLKQARRRSSVAEKDRLLDELRDETAATLEAVREKARELRPPALEDLGVVPALRAELRRHAEEIEPELVLEGPEVASAGSRRQRAALYRILKEAISNALRHAEADRIRTRVERVGGRIRGEVVDDGRGFDPEEVRRGDGQGLGLLAMRELARELGGRVAVDSGPDRGTRVRVDLPAGGTGAAPC